eukprot:8930799-Alexandrium_andersonii.AAC.1
MRDIRFGVAAAPAKRLSKVDLWLIDTGCGHDLVSREHANQMNRWIRRAAEPIQFSTANGLTQAEEVLPVFVRELGPGD